MPKFSSLGWIMGWVYLGRFWAYLNDQSLIKQLVWKLVNKMESLNNLNHNLLEVARSFTFTVLAQVLWGWRCSYSNTPHQQESSSVLGFQTPLVILTGFTVFHSLLARVFRCICVVHDHGISKGKLDSTTLKCIFIGYFATQKGFCCYHPPSPPSWKIFVSRDVTFYENWGISFSIVTSEEEYSGSEDSQPLIPSISST